MRRDKLKFAPRPFRDWRRLFSIFLVCFLVGMALYYWLWLPALNDLEARGRERATKAQGEQLNEQRLGEVAAIIDARTTNFDLYLNQ